MLLRVLPPTSLLIAELGEQEKQSQKPTPEQIRERQEFYARREVQHG